MFGLSVFVRLRERPDCPGCGETGVDVVNSGAAVVVKRGHVAGVVLVQDRRVGTGGHAHHDGGAQDGAVLADGLLGLQPGHREGALLEVTDKN